MNAQVKSYPLDDTTTGHLLRIAYGRFRVTQGLQDSAETGLSFANHWTDNGASIFLGQSRDGIVALLAMPMPD